MSIKLKISVRSLARQGSYFKLPFKVILNLHEITLLFCNTLIITNMKFYKTLKYIFLYSSVLLLFTRVNAQCDIVPDVHIQDGDVYIEDPCRGVVLTSPTGECYRLTVNMNGELETNVIPCITCSEVEDAPAFIQQFSDITEVGNSNCEMRVNIPFQLDYIIPSNLTVSVDVTGLDAASANLTVNQTATNGSISDYTLSGRMPIGTHTVTILAEDSNCNLTLTENFDITVIAPSDTPATFECKFVVKTIEDGPIPSVTLTADDIVSVTDGSSCGLLVPTMISSFSNDPTDDERIYYCEDIGDQQATTFIFDVIDSDGDGALDTMFREPCLVIFEVAPSPTPSPIFDCKKIVKPIGDDGTVTFGANEIVCVSETFINVCDPSLTHTATAAFSNDPTDVSRTYTCTDVNPGNGGTDIQVTMFIFDVLDADNDGLIDTLFREPCFVIQTITGELCP